MRTILRRIARPMVESVGRRDALDMTQMLEANPPSAVCSVCGAIGQYRWQPIIFDLKNALKGAQVVIIATRHKEYERKRKEIINLLDKKTYICDIWNIFKTNKMIFKAGKLT